MNPTERTLLAAAAASPFAVISHEFTQDSQGYGILDWGCVATCHDSMDEALAEFARRKAILTPQTSEMQGSRRFWTGEAVTAYALYNQEGETQLAAAESPREDA